jgi:hypothetical protein
MGSNRRCFNLAQSIYCPGSLNSVSAITTNQMTNPDNPDGPAVSSVPLYCHVMSGNDTTHYNVEDYEIENVAGRHEFAATKKELSDLLIATVATWQS